jgi:D-aspartate ligase
VVGNLTQLIKGMAAVPAVALFDNCWAPTMAFAYSLGRAGVPVHVYGNGANRWSRYCTRHLPCPPIERTDEFLPWLEQRVRSGEIGRVAPTTDLIAYYTSVLRQHFSPEVQRTIAPLEEIESALIKSRFTAACVAAGQAVPTTMTPDSEEGAVAAAAELGYPLILKPKSHLGIGTAERGGLIREEAALRSAFRRYEPEPGQSGLMDLYPELRWPLLQRYISSARQRVYSVTGIKDADTGIITATVSYKAEQWPADIGTSIAQIGVRDDTVLAAGLRTVDQLVSRGIFELELVADRNQLLAIDWNPRAFGFINLDIARGNDLPALWFAATLGPVTPLPPGTGTVPLEARHVVLYLLRRLFARPRAAAATVGQGSSAWISLVGSRSDPLPALIGNLMLLRHPRSLIRSQFDASSAADRASGASSSSATSR